MSGWEAGQPRRFARSRPLKRDRSRRPAKLLPANKHRARDDRYRADPGEDPEAECKAARRSRRGGMASGEQRLLMRKGDARGDRDAEGATDLLRRVEQPRRESRPLERAARERGD